MEDLKERQQKIECWIKEAAKLIKKAIHTDLVIKEKTNASDLVTNVDRSVERFLVDRIRTYYPNEQIMSEEGYGDCPSSLDGVVWFVDPIDGTTNFITQGENFAVMIAVYENGIGHLGYIYDVMKDRLYLGIKDQGAFVNGEKIPHIEDSLLSKGVFASSSQVMIQERFHLVREVAQESLGVRMIGSAGLEICRVSMQQTFVYVSGSLSPWDVAAGQVIAREVGVVCATLDGEPFDLLQGETAIFAVPTVYKQIMNRLDKKK